MSIFRHTIDVSRVQVVFCNGFSLQVMLSAYKLESNRHAFDTLVWCVCGKKNG